MHTERLPALFLTYPSGEFEYVPSQECQASSFYRIPIRFEGCPSDLELDIVDPGWEGSVVAAWECVPWGTGHITLSRCLEAG